MDPSSIKALMGKLNKQLTRALEAAAGTCIQRTHYEITAEHCLLKLLDQSKSDLAIIFGKLGISHDEARAELERSLAELNSGNHAKPRFSAILLEAISQAWNFGSLERGETSIRSAHLLVALLRDTHWLAYNRFSFLERLDESRLAKEFEALTIGSQEVAAVQSRALPAQAAEALQAFTVSLVEQAKKGEIDPIVERDREIYQVIDILSRRRKNNPILVGEPGVGKSAIVEGLALLIAEGKAPAVLEGVDLRTLDLGLLKAGASMKGEFEERLKQVIEAVQQSETPIIMFIDEAHNLIGAGGSAGAGDAANLLKPALARGKLRTVAATTWSEYKKYIEKDAALERRFQLVKVDEPNAQRATHMLRGLKQKYQEHHRVEVLDSAIEAACLLSERYLTGRQLPDKAIDLLDTACARVRMSLTTQPFDLTRLDNGRHALKLAIEEKEREEKLTDQKLEDLPGLRKQLAQLELEHGVLAKRWELEKKLVGEIVELNRRLTEGVEGGDLLEQRAAKMEALAQTGGEEQLVSYQVAPAVVAQIVSQWTGIPVGNMVKDDLAELLVLEKRLMERVLGQDHAAVRIAKAIKISKARVGNPETPIGVFLCVGPSGTGKTEMALTLADRLFGGERFTIQINMSEYQEKHTLSRLIGSPPGYVGYGEGGVLTEAVRQRPYSVVLLDEVEKGHPDVMNLFYQVFDKGHCADGEGRMIDFKNTVIMMTSNLGSSVIEEMCLEEPWPEADDLLEAIRPQLNRFLKPALLARMTVIPFRPISESVMKRIVALKLRKIALRLKQEHGISLAAESTVLQYISERCRLVEAGARNIDQILNGELLPLIAERILQQLLDGDRPKQLKLDLEEHSFSLHFS